MAIQDIFYTIRGLLQKTVKSFAMPLASGVLHSEREANIKMLMVKTEKTNIRGSTKSCIVLLVDYTLGIEIGIC